MRAQAQPYHPIRTCCRDGTLYRPDQSAGTAAWSLDTQNVQVLTVSRSTRLPTAARCSSSLSPMSQSTTTVQASLHGPVTVLWSVQHKTQLLPKLPAQDCVCACVPGPTHRPTRTYCESKPPSYPDIKNAKQSLLSRYQITLCTTPTSLISRPVQSWFQWQNTAQNQKRKYGNQITQKSRTMARSSSYLVILYCTVLCCVVLCQQTTTVPASLPWPSTHHATPPNPTQPEHCSCYYPP